MALEGQLTLFSQSEFAGVMLATESMRLVSYLSDNTIEQMRQSAQAYRDARDHLAPYKRLLDVYASRWFGNTPIKGKRGASDFDPTVELLRRDDAQAWLEDPQNPKTASPMTTTCGQDWWPKPPWRLLKRNASSTGNWNFQRCSSRRAGQADRTCNYGQTVVSTP